MSESEQYEGEIVDGRTGEIVPVGASKIQTPTLPQKNDGVISFDIVDLKDVGTLQLSEKAQAVLAESLQEGDIRIRPDGNIYVPWTWYADRLNRAFGVAGWGLIPQGMPLSKPSGTAVLVVWGHWFIVAGIPIGFAMGETTYFPSNNMMSYADACEGAKSNSLARNCKLLGMTLDLWDNEFGDKWKAKYAETYKDQNGKTKWRKRKSDVTPSKPEQAKVTPASVKKEPTKVISQPPTSAPPSVETVKAEWIKTAIAHHIMAKADDKIGAGNLKLLLGKLYEELAPFNAAVSLPQGIKLIESVHKAS